MPSEEQFRTEVHRIANSIAVDPDEHLAAVLAEGSGRRTPSRTHRRRLVPVAAAVSIAGAVAVGAVLAGVLPDDEGDLRPTGTVVLDGTPDGTVPSVFGQTRDSATALLEDQGLQVRYGEKASCDPEGRPVGTEPTTGTPVRPGTTVTVLLSYQAANTDCASDLREPWAFVDFATGRGPSPRFADEVRLFVDGAPTQTLTGTEASRGGWGPGSALDLLSRSTLQVLRIGDEYQAPWLEATTGTPPDSWCGVDRPAAVRSRQALILTIDFEEAAPPRCPTRVAVYETGGAIDTVVAWSAGTPGDDLPPIPDVVGLGLAEAREAITAAGYPVRVEELETCHPRPGVVEQAPTRQAVEEDLGDDPGWDGPVTLVIEVPHTRRDCAALDEAAEGFLAFARGGPPPSWAPEVTQLLGYTEWDTVSGREAADREAWSFCSGVAPEDCTVSALVVAAATDEVEAGEFADVTRGPSDQFCELIDRGGLPTDLETDQQIVLYPAEVSSCDDDWNVWLWIDAEGRIAAVNLLVPATALADGQ